MEVEQVVGIEMVADWYVYGEVHRKGEEVTKAFEIFSDLMAVAAGVG